MGGLGSGFSESDIGNDWEGLDTGESGIITYEGVASCRMSQFMVNRLSCGG